MEMKPKRLGFFVYASLHTRSVTPRWKNVAQFADWGV